MASRPFPANIIKVAAPSAAGEASNQKNRKEFGRRMKKKKEEEEEASIDLPLSTPPTGRLASSASGLIRLLHCHVVPTDDAASVQMKSFFKYFLFLKKKKDL